jgi:AcrR family transcriptional regulator
MALMGEGGAATRERILDAALEIAGREGLDALRTRRVAAEAGVNLGLLHYYFESKEALVEETLGRYFGEMQAVLGFANQRDAPASAEEVLVELFTGALSVATRRPALLFGLIGRLVTIVRESIQSGGDPEYIMEKQRVTTPFGPLVEVQGLLLGRIKPLIASHLGGDEALSSRRALQLFASVFHPILFTPFPGLVFGIDVSTEEKRRAYVRGVVEDTLRLPATK